MRKKKKSLELFKAAQFGNLLLKGIHNNAKLKILSHQIMPIKYTKYILPPHCWQNLSSHH